MRSKLFVPGSRPEYFLKALESQADAISFDLEDSVLGNRKAEARDNVGAFLQTVEVRSTNKLIIVRSNGIHACNFEADVMAIAKPSLEILNLPKVESAEDVHFAVAVLERVEANAEIACKVGILPTIESPKGLRRAVQIAAADSRVVGLQLGANDLFTELSIDRYDSANVHSAMFAVRMAAGEAGVVAIDGAFPILQDEQAFRAEAEMARRLGFSGKSCIHPRQISPANEIFQPTNEEVDVALRVIEASQQAESNGFGAFTIDGKMIDRPSIRRAEMTVAASRNLPNDR